MDGLVQEGQSDIGPLVWEVGREGGWRPFIIVIDESLGPRKIRGEVGLILNLDIRPPGPVVFDSKVVHWRDDITVGEIPLKAVVGKRHGLMRNVPVREIGVCYHGHRNEIGIGG